MVQESSLVLGAPIASAIAHFGELEYTVYKQFEVGVVFGPATLE